MPNRIFEYPVYIKETYLDSFGHMNNAVYLTLFEEARWELITSNGYGLKEMVKTGIGPTILEIKLTFSKEIKLREHILIKTVLSSYERKIAKITQTMIRGNEVCCVGEFTVGLFDLKERKLILPSPEWLHAIGAE